jgi:hypothetical protein
MIDDLERRLRFAMVAYVGGSRPMVSCHQVAEVLVRRAGIPRDAFSIHSYKPEDFLVVFSSEELWDRIASRPSLADRNFTLFFRRWTRLAAAQRVVVQSKVHLAIEGTPPPPRTPRIVRWQSTSWVRPVLSPSWPRRRPAGLTSGSSRPWRGAVT